MNETIIFTCRLKSKIIHVFFKDEHKTNKYRRRMFINKEFQKRKHNKKAKKLLNQHKTEDDENTHKEVTKVNILKWS